MADNAEPKSIAELADMGLRIYGVKRVLIAVNLVLNGYQTASRFILIKQDVRTHTVNSRCTSTTRISTEISLVHILSATIIRLIRCGIRCVVKWMRTNSVGRR